MSEKIKTFTDKQRMDWLETKSGYTNLWIARESTTGRGFRLHNTSAEGAKPTAREAIDGAMIQEAPDVH